MQRATLIQQPDVHHNLPALAGDLIRQCEAEYRIVSDTETLAYASEPELLDEILDTIDGLRHCVTETLDATSVALRLENHLCYLEVQRMTPQRVIVRTLLPE